MFRAEMHHARPGRARRGATIACAFAVSAAVPAASGMAAAGATTASTRAEVIPAVASRDVTALGRQADALATATLVVPGPRPAARTAGGNDLTATLRPTAAGAGLELLSDYVDVCGDGGTLDLRRVGVFVDRDDQQVGFDVIGCAGDGPPVEDLRLSWLVDLDVDGVADRAVVVRGRDRSAVVLGRPDDAEADPDGQDQEPGSPSDDLSDWSVLWQDAVGVAVDDRGRLRTSLLVPDHLLGGTDATFELVVTTSSIASQVVVDRLPEIHEAAVQHPVNCDEQVVVVRVDPAAAPRVRADLTVGGFRVTGDGDFLRVQPATPADRTAIAATPGVTQVRAPRTFQLARIPDDPYLDQWALAAMRAEVGFARRPGVATTIAVMDDGIDIRRGDLHGRVLPGWDAVNAAPLPATVSSDRGGHGTAVAGIAAAQRDNGIGVVGVNPEALLVPVRVSDASGCIDDASLVEGMRWLGQRGVDVANLSLGGPEESADLERAVVDLAATGTIIVAASGNNPTLDVFYPATYDEVIAVGAVGPDNIVASYTTGGPWLDIVAPGGAASAGPEGVAVMAEDGTIRRTAGTSFASPQVAGALSLWVGRPGARLGTDAARAALAATARDLGDPGRDDSSGFGALDLDAFLKDAPPLVADLPGFDGDPTTVDRLAVSDPVDAAVTVSRERFDDGEAAHAVLVGVDRPADAVAAAALLGDGPLLLTPAEGVPAEVLEELGRSVAPGGVVHLVGGTAALPAAVEEQLRDIGLVPRRLAGEGRIGTAIAVADEVIRLYGEPDQVLITRAGSAADAAQPWPDAIAAAAWAALHRTPMLLSDSAALSAPVATWLADHPAVDRVVLGGTGALADPVLTELDNDVAHVRRVHGADRAGTAAAVARDLFRVPAGGWRWFTVVNGRDAGGWVTGMLAAGLAADLRAPLLLLEEASVPAATAELATGCGDRPVELLLLGDSGLVSEELRVALGTLATSC